MLCINTNIQHFLPRFEHKYATSGHIRIHFVRKPARGAQKGRFYLCPFDLNQLFSTFS